MERRLLFSPGLFAGKIVPDKKGRVGMKRITTRFLFGALLAAASTTPVYAQATRTWVSGVGDDLNPCSRTAPCKTFAGAISKTAAGGEINCLDPGGYGTLNITKSMSINCEYTLGSVLNSSVNGFIINVPAGTPVTLKGLEIEGAGTGVNGITIIQGGIVHLHKLQIRRQTANGINFAPTAAAELFVSEVYIS